MSNEKQQLETIWSRFVQLSADSTGHGYHNIFKARLLPIRIMWVLLFTTSTSFCVYLFIGSINNYFKYEVTTRTRLEYESKMKLPMISICNSKPFMTRFAYDYAIQEFLEFYGPLVSPQIASVLYGNFTDPNNLSLFNADPYLNQIMFLIQNKIADPTFNQTIQQALGLIKKQFFVSFMFNSDTVPSDYFVWYFDPNYGNCFKFNSGKTQNGSSIDLLEQTASGYANGIFSVNFLDVFSNQTYNFMNLYNTYTLGLKVSIDDQSSIPLYASNMIPMKPGTCTYINIAKTVSKRLPRPFSSCQDLTDYHSVLYDEFLKLNKSYSQQVCYQLCKQMKVITTCNCSIMFYPNVDSVKSCQTLNQVNCYNNLTLDESGCDDHCPLECESIDFEFTTAAEIFPDQNNYVILKSNAQISGLFRNANVSLASAPFEAVSNSLACVYIYYQDLKTTRIEESRAMTVVCLKIY
jgi:hypothetical protein